MNKPSGVVPLALIHADHEAPALISSYLTKSKAKLETVALHKECLPAHDISEYSHLIVMGGPMNVYEESKYPFLSYENKLIKKCLQSGIPILGICLGAQLIAKAMDVEVISGGSREIGWYDVSLTEAGTSDRIFSSFPEHFKVFQWHSDTFNIPESATHLASSRLVTNQAFAVDERVYALQFHLEVTRDMVVDWLDKNRNEIKSLEDIDPAQIISKTDYYLDGVNRLCELFCEKFFSLKAAGH